MKRLLAIFTLGLLLCAAGYAQDLQPRIAAPNVNIVPIGQVGAAFISTVKNAPYSATEVFEHTQTLADGTHITRKATTVLYRDSMGRTRTETENGLVTISDPIGGATYRLDPKTQTFRKIQTIQLSVDAQGAYTTGKITLDDIQAQQHDADLAALAAQTGAPKPHVTDESLGNQTMQGVLVQGTRTTTVYPEGFMGNDRPITVTSEVWYSPDLHIAVLRKLTDPRNGDNTTQLINIQVSEPNPSLFQVPANYTQLQGVGGGGGRRGN